MTHARAETLAVGHGGCCMENTLRFARTLDRGEQKVVAVYRDPRIRSDDEKGTRYTHACEQWQRRAFRWSPYSTSTVCGLRVMVALALALALARQLDFSTRVRVRWHKVDTSKPLFPP